MEQRQAEELIDVDSVVMEDILVHTNRHPYLVQYLCQRLYDEDTHGRPTLRPPRDEDLEPDHLLAGFFLIDFQHMTHLERRILLTVARKMVMSEAEIVAALADDVPARIRMTQARLAVVEQKLARASATPVAVDDTKGSTINRLIDAISGAF